MTEAELRAILEQICRDLRRGARTSIRKVVIPTVVGMGLTMSSCTTDDTGAKDVAAETQQSGETDQPDTATDAATDTTPDDVGPQPLYAAPQDVVDDAGPQPLYAAPADVEEDIQADDAGPQPLYAAPTDAGPQPEDVAEDVEEDTQADDAGPQPLYAGPDVGPADAGPQPLYGAPQPQDAG